MSCCRLWIAADARRGDRWIEEPSDRAGPNGSRPRPPAHVRHPPEKFTAAPHKMAPHMVKPTQSSTCFRTAAPAGPVLRQKRGKDFDLFQQRRFPGPCPCLVQTLEHQRSTRQARPSREEQKEGQKYG